VPDETDPIELSVSRVEAARSGFGNRVLRTPVLEAEWIGEAVGGRVVLKAENLQRTGSFKVRGASARIDRLEAEEAERGVVAASAGNHGQAVAYAARSREVGCRVFMPAGASVAKIDAVEAFGGEVSLGGASVEECVRAAREHAAQTGATFIHPFDDPDVLAGQGTLALELLERVPEPAAVVLPVGGGGLAGAGAAILKQLRPRTRVIGVQVEGCAPYVEVGEGAEPPAAGRVHIADGIAVKRPGRLTAPLIERYVDELCVVGEDAIAEAMVELMQRSKLVAEGAGAVGLAAVLAGKARVPDDGTSVVVISGGNVDVSVLVAIARRHESAIGRRFHLFTRVSDRPGALATLLSTVAEAGANVLAAEHRRDGVPLHVGETGIELVLETRGREHSRAVAEALRREGYPLEDTSLPPEQG
jgi:threonine dehydratase